MNGEIGGCPKFKRVEWGEQFELSIRFALVSLLVAVAAGCGALDPGGGSSLEKAREEGVIKVGFANEKPYAYRTEDGEVTGEAVEIARHVFKQMGIEKIEPILTDFGQLIPGLKAKRFDAITAGMYITPERCREVAFAHPEYRIGEALAVKKGNPKNIRSYEDIANNPDVTVAVMQGAIEKQYFEAGGCKGTADQKRAGSARRLGHAEDGTGGCHHHDRSLAPGSAEGRGG